MCRVNFVQEYNAIIRYCMDNGLTGREKLLWLALFDIANRRAEYNEPEKEFVFPSDYYAVSNNELSLFSTLDKRGIETIRNALKQRGVIDFVAGYKNRNMPRYKLNYLTVRNKNVPNSVPKDVPKNDPNSVPKDDPNMTPRMYPTVYPAVSPYNKLNINNYPNENDMEFEKKIGIYTNNWWMSDAGKRGACGKLTDWIAETCPALKCERLYDFVLIGIMERGLPPMDIYDIAMSCTAGWADFVSRIATADPKVYRVHAIGGAEDG